MVKNTQESVLYFCSRLPSSVQSGLDLRVRGQILALLGFAKVFVFALAGKGDCFDSRITSWRSSNNEKVSNPIDAMAGMSALNKGDHPFGARFSIETAEELRQEIRAHKPSLIIISRIDLSAYLGVIKEEFNGQVILDLDESVFSTGQSILGILKHVGQALVFRAFSESVKKVERVTIGEVDQVWVSSEVESSRLMSSYPELRQKSPRISVIPNCVDTEKYKVNSGVQRSQNTIIYPASFAYEPSLDAAKFLIEELMPILPTSVKLKFVGSHLPNWIRNQGASNISSEGPVSDIVPHLQSATALVVPLRAGGGTRLKVVEALASGLPVISTEFGVEGLGLVPGLDYLKADSASDFRDRCLELFSNPDLSENLSKRGKETAKLYFSTISLEQELTKLLTVV
jgi:glycosyltransferase involved in cell wall biosynthesis